MHESNKGRLTPDDPGNAIHPASSRPSLQEIAALAHALRTARDRRDAEAALMPDAPRHRDAKV